jgi:O-acetyl-ADP-ribose deacetylase (regulator of RNase III)
MFPSVVEVEMAPNSSRPRKKRTFGRTGHRSPAAMSSTSCCLQDDWVKQTLQGVLIEVAALKASSACNPVTSEDLTLNWDVPPPPPPTSDAALCHRLDSEYAAFVAHEKFMEQFYTYPTPPLPPNVIEVVGDIFEDAPATMALGHSVAEDLEMSAGIAVHFKQKFGQVDVLLSMGRTVGQVAVLPVAQQDGSVRYVFYVITKKRSRGTRPTLSDFAAAVHNLADACTMLGVKKLALPRIGTMKDKLQWCDVRRIICEAFEGRETEVYVFRRDKKSSPPPMQLVDFVEPLLQKTPPAGRTSLDTSPTPPFLTPATPQGIPAPEETRSRPLPDEGAHSASAPGPCASKVMSEKKQDAGRARSQVRVDTRKTLITAQGPDRSVQISTTPALTRLLNDLDKSSNRRKKCSSIPRPVTPTNLPNSKTPDTFPNVIVNSDSQCPRQPPNEAEAGGRPAASLAQRSSVSLPAEPQAGEAKSPHRAVNQNIQTNPLKLGGHRPFKHLSAKTGNTHPKNLTRDRFQPTR